RRIPRTEFAPHLELIRASEVDTQPRAPGGFSRKNPSSSSSPLHIQRSSAKKGHEGVAYLSNGLVAITPTEYATLRAKVEELGRKLEASEGAVRRLVVAYRKRMREGMILGGICVLLAVAVVYGEVQRLRSSAMQTWRNGDGKEKVTGEEWLQMPTTLPEPQTTEQLNRIGSYALQSDNAKQTTDAAGVDKYIGARQQHAFGDSLRVAWVSKPAFHEVLHAGFVPGREILGHLLRDAETRIGTQPRTDVVTIRVFHKIPELERGVVDLVGHVIASILPTRRLLVVIASPFAIEGHPVTAPAGDVRSVIVGAGGLAFQKDSVHTSAEMRRLGIEAVFRVTKGRDGCDARFLHEGGEAVVDTSNQSLPFQAVVFLMPEPFHDQLVRRAVTAILLCELVEPSQIRDKRIRRLGRGGLLTALHIAIPGTQTGFEAASGTCIKRLVETLAGAVFARRLNATFHTGRVIGACTSNGET
ncbi:MAG: hypothetical protein L6R39_007035, partial [Caloplaca ligustica]